MSETPPQASPAIRATQLARRDLPPPTAAHAVLALAQAAILAVESTVTELSMPTATQLQDSVPQMQELALRGLTAIHQLVEQQTQHTAPSTAPAATASPASGRGSAAQAMAAMDADSAATAAKYAAELAYAAGRELEAESQAAALKEAQEKAARTAAKTKVAGMTVPQLLSQLQTLETQLHEAHQGVARVQQAMESKLRAEAVARIALQAELAQVTAELQQLRQRADEATRIASTATREKRSLERHIKTVSTADLHAQVERLTKANESKQRSLDELSQQLTNERGKSRAAMAKYDAAQYEMQEMQRVLLRAYGATKAEWEGAAQLRAAAKIKSADEIVALVHQQADHIATIRTLQNTQADMQSALDASLLQVRQLKEQVQHAERELATSRTAELQVRQQLRAAQRGTVGQQRESALQSLSSRPRSARPSPSRSQVSASPGFRPSSARPSASSNAHRALLGSRRSSIGTQLTSPLASPVPWQVPAPLPTANVATSAAAASANALPNISVASPTTARPASAGRSRFSTELPFSPSLLPNVGIAVDSHSDSELDSADSDAHSVGRELVFNSNKSRPRRDSLLSARSKRSAASSPAAPHEAIAPITPIRQSKFQRQPPLRLDQNQVMHFTAGGGSYVISQSPTAKSDLAKRYLSYSSDRMKGPVEGMPAPFQRSTLLADAIDQSSPLKPNVVNLTMTPLQRTAASVSDRLVQAKAAVGARAEVAGER